MKKNILKATLVVAFALIAGMNVYNAQQSDVMSDLALANVEALASGESSTTNRYQTMGYCALWNEKRETKRAKLLQYAERVWNITEGSDDERIDAAIAATRNFFEQLGVPTHLSDYGLDGSSIPALLKKLEEHGMTQLGENHDITLDVSRRIYEAAR